MGLPHCNFDYDVESSAVRPVPDVIVGTEGLGLDILDALHCGTAVVSTAYSGNMDVCNSETAWLVDFDLTPVAPSDYVFVEPGHLWAEPRLSSAVAALHDVYGSKTRRKTRIAAAQRHAPSIASPQAFAERLNGLLSERLNGAPD